MTKARVSSAADPRSLSPVEPAAVVGIEPDGRLAVRVGVGAGRTRKAIARLAHLPGYHPRPGDRVLVATGPGEIYAIAVLHVAPTDEARSPANAPAPAPPITLPDGSTAAVSEGALEVRDPAGRLVVRYSNGSAEVSAPERDLVLSAPNGRVRLQAGTDVHVEAARDLVQSAGRKVAVAAGAQGSPQLTVEAQSTHLRTDRLQVHAKVTRLVSGSAEVLLRTLATTAERVAAQVGESEITAGRLVERANEALREVRDLLSTRAGRARTEVTGAFTLESGRTSLVSREETTVDGKKILLG